jgi:hypothetical protein
VRIIDCEKEGRLLCPLNAAGEGTLGEVAFGDGDGGKGAFLGAAR